MVMCWQSIILHYKKKQLQIINSASNTYKLKRFSRLAFKSSRSWGEVYINLNTFLFVRCDLLLELKVDMFFFRIPSVEFSWSRFPEVYNFSASICIPHICCQQTAPFPTRPPRSIVMFTSSCCHWLRWRLIRFADTSSLVSSPAKRTDWSQEASHFPHTARRHRRVSV